MAENTEEIIEETQQPTQTEEITQDTLKRKGGTASVSQYQRNLTVGGKDFVTISQDVEITNPNSPKRKFESQQISIFEDKNILTTISQRHNDSGASNVVAYLQKTGTEKGKAKLEFCLGADYINNIINNNDYSNKQNLIDILGEKDENGFYHLEATDAHISEDLNLDTLNFKTKDNETYGIMFSALGMQLKYANGAIITKPLNLKENGKEAKEGEDYPFDLSMSSVCFEKDKPENLVISTAISQEVLDNMQVSALRSRSRTNREKRQTLYISDETRLEYVPLGIKQGEIGYEQLDFKIENGQTFVYMQRSVEGQKRSKKPCFLKVDGASFVKSTETGKEYLSLSLVRGTENSNVYVPIDKITKENREYLANDLLKASFEKSAKSSGDAIENTEIAGRPVYHKNVDQNHIVSGYNVASLVRHPEQKVAEESKAAEESKIVDTPPADDNAGDDDGNGVAIVENIGENESSANSDTNSVGSEDNSEKDEEKKSEEKVVEEESNENNENNDGKDGKKEENEEEKPKKKWSEWLTNLMSGDTFLGVSVTVMLFGTFFPPLALAGGALLLGFGAAKSGFVSMFEGLSFKKAKLSKKDLLEQLDKQKKRQLQKAERQKNRNISKEDKRLLKDVNYQIDKRNKLVKKLRNEKAEVSKAILKENKRLDKNIAQQKELYETILTKVNPEELDIDKSLLSPELNKLLNNYNGVKQQIADQQKARENYIKTLQDARDNALTNQKAAIKKKANSETERDNQIAAEREIYNGKINDLQEEFEKNTRYASMATNKKEEARYKKEAERAKTKLAAAQNQLNKFNEYVEKGVDKFTKQWKKNLAEYDKVISSATEEYEARQKDLTDFTAIMRERKDSYSIEIEKLKIEQETVKEEYRKELKPEQDRFQVKYNALISEKNTLNEQAETNSDKFSKASNIDSLNTQIAETDIDIKNARKERKSGLENYTLQEKNTFKEKKKEIEEQKKEKAEIIEDYYIDTQIKKAVKSAEKESKKSQNGEHPILGV